MKFYRNQPQADSHIYRSVFIEYVQPADRSDERDQGSARSSAAEPEVVSGRNTIYGTESRGDIIYFYNKIFVPKMQQFAMRFSTSSSQVRLHFIFSFPLRHTRWLIGLFFISPEQSASVATAQRSTIDLTQKNLTLSRCVRAAADEAKRFVPISTYADIHHRAESVEGTTWTWNSYFEFSLTQLQFLSLGSPENQLAD